jgi:hypothetical protein
VNPHVRAARRSRIPRSDVYRRTHKSRNDDGGCASRELGPREWQRRRQAEPDVNATFPSVRRPTRCKTTQEGSYVPIVTDAPADATQQVTRHADAKRVDDKAAVDAAVLAYLRGHAADGTGVVSYRVLAETLGYSRQTVRASMHRLKRDGVLADKETLIRYVITEVVTE